MAGREGVGVSIEVCGTGVETIDDVLALEVGVGVRVGVGVAAEEYGTGVETVDDVLVLEEALDLRFPICSQRSEPRSMTSHMVLGVTYLSVFSPNLAC